MTVYLRLKRKISDVPVNSLDAINANKRHCSDLNFVTFEYVGTQFSLSSLASYSKHSAHGERKLIFNKNTATLFEEDGVNSKICEVCHNS